MQALVTKSWFFYFISAKTIMISSDWCMETIVNFCGVQRVFRSSGNQPQGTALYSLFLRSLVYLYLNLNSSWTSCRQDAERNVKPWIYSSWFNYRKFEKFERFASICCVIVVINLYYDCKFILYLAITALQRWHIITWISLFDIVPLMHQNRSCSNIQ